MEQSVILATARLGLREFKREDADALLAVLGDRIAMQFYPAPFDRDEVDHWIARNQARYTDTGFGLWALVVKPSGELIGDCGCFVRELQGQFELELGWHVRRDLWGRGYATEAAWACVNYAFAKLGARRVIAMIRPENVPSRRVAEKNGLTCEKIIFWRGYDHCIYAIGVETWQLPRLSIANYG